MFQSNKKQHLSFFCGKLNGSLHYTGSLLGQAKNVVLHQKKGRNTTQKTKLASISVSNAAKKRRIPLALPGFDLIPKTADTKPLHFTQQERGFPTFSSRGQDVAFVNKKPAASPTLPPLSFSTICAQSTSPSWLTQLEAALRPLGQSETKKHLFPSSINTNLIQPAATKAPGNLSLAQGASVSHSSFEEVPDDPSELMQWTRAFMAHCGIFEHSCSQKDYYGLLRQIMRLYYHELHGKPLLPKDLTLYDLAQASQAPAQATPRTMPNTLLESPSPSFISPIETRMGFSDYLDDPFEFDNRIPDSPKKQLPFNPPLVRQRRKKNL